MLPRDASPGEATLLHVEGLTKRYPIAGRWGRRSGKEVTTVSDVSFTLRRGETLGVVGESGCGKTTVARMLVRLIEPSAGQVQLEGEDVTAMTPDAVRTRLRARARLIFQDPDAALNPGYTVGEGLRRALWWHGVRDAAEVASRQEALFAAVGLDAGFLSKYPDELSGGEKRRLGVARALCTDPALVLADEPLSGLDVVLQEYVLALLLFEQERRGFGLVLISHDLDRVLQVCHRVLVMHRGRIVEEAVLRVDGRAAPEPYRHPYTLALHDARTRVLGRADGRDSRAMGTSPRAGADPASAAGCMLAGQCVRHEALGRPTTCLESRPALHALGVSRRVACHYPDATP